MSPGIFLQVEEDVTGLFLFCTFYARLAFHFLNLSCSQDSELSYAHRDGRLLELIDEAWQKDELPNDGTRV